MNTKNRMSRILAKNLLYFRQKQGLTQDSLAKLTGLSRTTYRELEEGTGNPSAFLLYRLSQGLKIQMETLLVQNETHLPPMIQYIAPKANHNASGSISMKYQTACKKLTLHSIELSKEGSVTFPPMDPQTPQLIICIEGQTHIQCSNGSGILKSSEAMETLASFRKRIVSVGPGKVKVLVVTGQRDPFEVF